MDTPTVMDGPVDDQRQPTVSALGSRRHVLAIGLLAAAVMAVGAAILLAQPQTHPGSAGVAGARTAHTDRIAYVDASGVLNTIAADGSNLRSYPIADVALQFPAWSPDGTHIAAVGTAPLGGVIYVIVDGAPAAPSTAASMPAAGAGGATQPGQRPSPVLAYGPSSEGPIYTSWSPSGRRLAFLTNEPDGLALRTASADGNGPDTVVRRAQPMYWAWIDDGHLLVHSGSTAQDEFLGEVGLDASPPAAIGAGLGQFQAPGISSDGAYRAFVSADPGGAMHVVVERRRDSAHVESAVVGASALGWSPASDLLAFTSPDQAADAPFGSLNVIDPTTGSTRTLLGGLVVAYFWSPNGKTIATLSFVLGGGGTTAAAVPIAQAAAPSLQLAFVDVATGAVRSKRAIRLPDNVVTQFLPFFDQYAQSHRVWSPASDSIVLPLLDDAGQSHITILPADGTTPRPIADGVAAFWSP